MKEVRLSPEAMADLGGIRRYTVKRWGALQARAYLSDLGILFDRVARGSARTQAADDIRPSYRRIRFRSHVVFLVEDEAAIRIMRVLHARMDFDLHL
jgi:toxin ParE1/3/4